MSSFQKSVAYDPALFAGEVEVTHRKSNLLDNCGFATLPLLFPMDMIFERKCVQVRDAQIFIYRSRDDYEADVANFQAGCHYGYISTYYALLGQTKIVCEGGKKYEIQAWFPALQRKVTFSGKLIEEVDCVNLLRQFTSL